MRSHELFINFSKRSFLWFIAGFLFEEFVGTHFKSFVLINEELNMNLEKLKKKKFCLH